MTKFQTELKKVVDRVKETQTKLQDMLRQQEWIEEAKNYAEKQGREIQKLLKTDATRVRDFLEKERRELEKFQARIPDEFKKLKDSLQEHQKEVTALFKGVLKTPQAQPQTPPQKTAPKKERRRVPRNKT